MISRRRWLFGSAALAAAGPLGVRPATAASSPLALGERAWHALNRLAFGPRPGDAAAVHALGPERWLGRFIEEQLEPDRLAHPVALQERLALLDTLPLGQAELIGRYREARRAVQEERRKAQPQGRDMAAPVKAGGVGASVRPVLLQAATARFARALHSPAQLEEVLVDFWFNHFNVFHNKGLVNALVGNYEREAIRPHVLGSFRAMLGAVAHHPAMLVYLDNNRSVAPGSPSARSGPAGLNENYARELMELHTLGVDGGYRQQDVTELARILTGWTVDPDGTRTGAGGSAFRFNAKRHDRGVKHWLGHTIEPAGEAEGEKALDILAAHPATAHHLSYKLAQAFVADQPPPALVQRMAQRYTASGGQLKAVMKEMLSADEFWQPQAWAAKFKTPYQYLLSSLRAVGADFSDVQPLLGWLKQAGMPLYGATTPDGYKNTAAAWMNPEGLTQRVQFARALARRHPAMPALLDTLGPTVGPATRAAVAAEPPALQTALLLASPDFMRC
ncbi:DUF1800 domain-containing protein [Schlegelella sp. S2-27]|uniref:DUF1800 domain-containing protein n=1 Tax=Caldimonas mangrovi TaxID=2944811 RepID=A0ABT0YKS6_9BURK|nr:DUF1800 domain-containing protein [Caldimonas mangrovi]MCM5679345.1 DUF1800 domain-containing protein [Caldimonas mangrovi]